MKSALLLCLLACVALLVALADADCISNPSDPSCTSFTMSSAEVQKAITDNCKMMDYMRGCTLQRICTSSNSSKAVTSSPYCQEFSILKDLCVDMPGMSPCKNYTSMCASGSVVEQCNTPILSWPNTTGLSDLVEKLCGEMEMTPCDQCPAKTSALLNCDVLQVYSDICLSMWMDGCEAWQSECKVIPDWPLCTTSTGGGGGGGGGQPSGSDAATMKPYLSLLL